MPETFAHSRPDLPIDQWQALQDHWKLVVRHKEERFIIHRNHRS